MKIRPGTICFLVNLRAEWSTDNGKVVEVLTPAVHDGDDGSLRHRVDSEWLRERFGDREVLARPDQLKPIAGPKPPVSKRTKQRPTCKA